MATRPSAAVRPATLSARNRQLLSRFSYGVNEELLASLGTPASASAWFARQLVPSRISDPRGAKVESWFPRLADSPSATWRAFETGDRAAWQYGFELGCMTLARKMVSSRQLHEVMADFWSNLLYIPTGEERSFPWRKNYDEAIRKRSLTTFKSLLRATVVHPAMSGWLNSSDNTKHGINENLGRELLELYTVGRPAGYDEEDVKNSARLLTGFRVRIFDGYDATYDPDLHWTGKIKVLDFTHDNADPDGRAAVTAYLDHLAMHPATARRIAHRLCVRFVSDDPSDAIVSVVARAFRNSGTDIKTTLRALVAHPEFVSAPRRLRSPSEDLVATARALGIRPSGAGSQSFVQHLYWESRNLGQQPFAWPRPDGFPEASGAWSSPARVLRSWDAHWAMAGNWWNSAEISMPKPASQLPTAWPRTLRELVDHQSRLLLGRPATTQLQSSVASALGTTPDLSCAAASDVSGWGWTVLRATVLNHPEGMLR